jgi:TonB family protein
MIVFVLKLTLCWGVFALLYHGLLRGQTFFAANRAYLLGTLFLGLLLASGAFGLPADVEGLPLLSLPVVTVGMQQAARVADPFLQLSLWWAAYVLGAALALLRLVWGLWQLGLLIGTAPVRRMADGVRLLRSPVVRAPFSFFRWIVVPADLPLDSPNPDTRLLLAHERAHLRGLHSVDVLLLELLCVVFWFHPLAHWYRRSLRSVHEYLADAAAVRHHDRKQYGLLLIRQSQSGMPVAIVHHFFQSPLKQRITMLMKRHSAPLQALRYGLLLPLTVFFALLFQQVPGTAQTTQSQSAENVDKGKTYEMFDIKTPPEFPGGERALMEFLAGNIQYPEADEKAKREGVVVLSFVVAKDGAIRDIKVLKGISADIDREATRVLGIMPKWKPGLNKDGEIVQVRFTIPIRFRLS